MAHTQDKSYFLKKLCGVIQKFSEVFSLELVETCTSNLQMISNQFPEHLGY